MKESEVDIADVEFLETLKESEYSVVFKVALHGTLCVMKVYHDNGPSPWDPPHRASNIFIRESTAYQRLKAKGLCDQGGIPDFHGTITKIDPARWPELHMFVGDKLRPNAILIEYIPNMQEVNLSNFSMKHLLKLRHILEEIHRARVRHGDPYPRNMMIVPGSPGRALWIDFDRAQTFPENVPLSERQSKWFQHEARMVEYFANALAQDHAEGELRRAYGYYYE